MLKDQARIRNLMMPIIAPTDINLDLTMLDPAHTDLDQAHTGISSAHTDISSAHTGISSAGPRNILK